MKSQIIVLLLATLAVAAIPVLGLAGNDEADTVDQRMAGLIKSCEASADARDARHEAEVLYKRLGGYDKILELTTEIVRLHGVNESIKRTLHGVDEAMLAKHVADFVAAGTGGVVSYTGRGMPDSHRHLNLTTADFLAAGGDVMTAMKNLGYGQDEIDEVICILVSLKDQVVFE
ncbi:MAG: group 1 truncated hemoglobin [bacterium]|nr:group 1 truncated hemoglobin [bacterium]